MYQTKRLTGKEYFTKFVSWVFLMVLSMCAAYLMVDFFFALAIAQDVAPVADADAIKQIIEILGGTKGATAISVVLAVFQIFIIVAKTSWLDRYIGKYKFLIISGCSVVVCYVTLDITTDLNTLSILLHSTVLTAIQVFANQAYKQIVTDKGQK